MTTPDVLLAYSLDELLPILHQHRAQGQRIVFTNGVFDLLHPGHIRYLRTAKSHGDVMVVGLNSDSSTQRLKGNGRPLLPQHERTKILAALEMVDYVTVFDDDTPLKVIEALQPDVLVKGGDYQLNEIVGRNEVESRGGKVVTVPFESGNSSSNIVDRIIRSAQKTN